MKALTLMMVVMLCGAAMANKPPDEDDRAALQGVWQSTGRSAPYSLVFCGDALIGVVGDHPLLGAQTSGYRAAYGGIDIVREDGLQLGIYKLQGDVLILMLADVGTPRPFSLDIPNVERRFEPNAVDRKTHPPRTQQRYVFERAR